MNMSTPEIEELKKYIQEKFGKQLGCPVLCSNFRVKKKLVLLLSL